MIDITIYQSNDKITRIKSKGHAGYADNGQDIVCAAVSVLMINTFNSVDRFTFDRLEISSMDEEDGVMDITFPKEYSHDTKLLLDSLILGLKEITKEYGASFISLNFKEV